MSQSDTCTQTPLNPSAELYGDPRADSWGRSPIILPLGKVPGRSFLGS